MSKRILCICGSAGALEDVQTIVGELATVFDDPMVVLLHQQPERKSFLADVLQRNVTIPVRQPDDKEEIHGKTVYCSSPGYHLQIEPDHTFSYTSDALVKYSIPSIDVLLETAARAYHENVTVILLSGASDDGTNGIKWVLKYGGTVLVQSPEEASYKTMVKAAIKAHPSVHVLPVKKMIQYVKEVKQHEAS